MSITGGGRGLRIASIAALGTIFVLVMTFLPADHSISKAAPAEQKVCRGGTLRISYRDDPSVFDPALSATTIVRFLTFLMYDTLFEYKVPELQLVPRLAESWEQPNPTTFVIKLRRGVRFHNGLGMRAEDVKFTLDRIRDPKTGSPWSSFFRDIDRMEVVDPWTIRILLKQPSGPLLGFLTHPGTSIVSRAYVEGGGDLKTRPIGTGPFQFVKREGSNIFFTRNRSYYRQGLPYVDEVVWKVIADVSAAGAALRTGDIDVAIKADPEIIPLFQRLPNFQVVGGLTGSVNALWFNVREKPLDDWRVRQAIAWALDRDQILQVARGELGEVLPAGPIPRAHWAAVKQPIFRQDYNKARALLREAGMTQGFKLNITVWSALLYQVRGAEAIREQLRPLNIETNIDLRDQATFFDLFNGKKISTVFGWAGLVDPDDFADRFVSDSGTNKYYFADPRVDELAARGRRETDRGKRAVIYGELQKLLAELSPAAFLYADRAFSIAPRKVKGVGYPFTEQPTFLKEMWLDGCR